MQEVFLCVFDKISVDSCYEAACLWTFWRSAI